MSESGLSQKAFAINARQPQSVISDALNSRRHLSAEWIWLQENDFLVKFFALVSLARGLTAENAAAARRRRIVELIELLLVEAA